MKAAQFREFGGPEVLEVVEVPKPHAQAGQVRIRGPFKLAAAVLIGGSGVGKVDTPARTRGFKHLH